MDGNTSRERKGMPQGEQVGQRGQEKHRASRADGGQGKTRGKNPVKPTFTKHSSLCQACVFSWDFAVHYGSP